MKMSTEESTTTATGTETRITELEDRIQTLEEELSTRDGRSDIQPGERYQTVVVDEANTDGDKTAVAHINGTTTFFRDADVGAEVEINEAVTALVVDVENGIGKAVIPDDND